MAAPYLEHFLDTLEPLPADLQRNFALMKDLDTRTQDLVSKINNLSEDYITQVNELTSGDKVEKFDEIHTLFEKAKTYSDDKVQLATQTYEMVDKHIRRLDTELTKFEAELKDKQVHPTKAPAEEGKKKGHRGRGDKKGFNPKNVIKDEKKKIKDEAPQALSLLAAPSILSQGEVLDMPVDPNEPTYCLCHQVSYGEMIGCDNTDCPIEWFHFGCVALTAKPKGKWYCPKCITDRRKK